MIPIFHFFCHSHTSPLLIGLFFNTILPKIREKLVTGLQRKRA
ncbi:hypothetical protein HMPREF3219_0200249 [Streptococcus salivarius]|nr:hypothetical protein HMPREF3219_0200249 [Streptococcus salivarius]